jgi:hypothetical protein
VDRAVNNYVEWGDLAWAHCDNLGVDKLEMIGAEEVAIGEGATEEPPEVEEEAASEA